jgi:hypothetical protein
VVFDAANKVVKDYEVCTSPRVAACLMLGACARPVAAVCFMIRGLTSVVLTLVARITRRGR